MDTNDGKRYEINMRLPMILGLYRILNPSTVRIFGYNVYHIMAMFAGSLMCVIIILLFPFASQYMNRDMISVAFFLGCIYNYLLSFFKIIVLVYYSDDIWKCLDIISLNLLSYTQYNKKIFEMWRERSVQVSCVYVIMAFFMLSSWCISPQFHSTVDPTSNGTYAHSKTHRMDWLNVNFTILDKSYSVLNFAEIIVLVCYLYFSIIFDAFMACMCFALYCHQETICDGIESLVPEKRPKNASNINEKIQMQLKEKINELNMMIKDHQKVMKCIRSYRDIFQATMLVQLLVGIISITLFGCILINIVLKGEIRTSMMSTKLISISWMYLGQLIVTCKLYRPMAEKASQICQSILLMCVKYKI